jgi:hypothetical protein
MSSVSMVAYNINFSFFLKILTSDNNRQFLRFLGNTPLKVILHILKQEISRREVVQMFNKSQKGIRNRSSHMTYIPAQQMMGTPSDHQQTSVPYEKTRIHDDGQREHYQMIGMSPDHQQMMGVPPEQYHTMGYQHQAGGGVSLGHPVPMNSAHSAIHGMYKMDGEHHPYASQATVNNVYSTGQPNTQPYVQSGGIPHGMGNNAYSVGTQNMQSHLHVQNGQHQMHPYPSQETMHTSYSTGQQSPYGDMTSQVRPPMSGYTQPSIMSGSQHMMQQGAVEQQQPNPFHVYAHSNQQEYVDTNVPFFPPESPQFQPLNGMGPQFPYPVQMKQSQSGKKEPSQFQSILSQFKSSDGNYDINKMMNTAGTVMNTMNQLGGMVKQVGAFFSVK